MGTATVSTGSAVKEKVTDFIISNYLFGDASRTPKGDESLIESGIVDSTGILELIEFLETEFQVKVDEDEMVPKNLDSLNALTSFVNGKRAG